MCVCFVGRCRPHRSHLQTKYTVMLLIVTSQSSWTVSTFADKKNSSTILLCRMSTCHFIGSHWSCSWRSHPSLDDSTDFDRTALCSAALSAVYASCVWLCQAFPCAHSKPSWWYKHNIDYGIRKWLTACCLYVLSWDPSSRCICFDGNCISFYMCIMDFTCVTWYTCVCVCFIMQMCFLRDDICCLGLFL